MKGGHGVEEWKKIVKEAVEVEAVSKWLDGVKSHRKLEIYESVKEEWGMKNI